jgi:K(+)-stimulated pyrophosphate-energized sodium pump
MPVVPPGRTLARLAIAAGVAFLFLLVWPSPVLASELDLRLPDLSSQTYFGFLNGWWLLFLGIIVSAAGLVFGLIVYNQLKNLPVHSSMRSVSELIYETCKTYLITQGKFLVFLWLFIGAIIFVYFFYLQHLDGLKVAIILAFSVIGILGSYGVAWFGIRVNTFANSRTAFAALTGKAYPCYAIPLKAGISIGMLLISVELLLMLVILLFIPGDYAGPCFIGFAIGESLGAAALRVAGGIFTKIADIGADLMKIVFKIKEDDARNPGVIADCTGDNAGDSVGPSADGFETYGVTGVALITFILLAIPGWLFVSADQKAQFLHNEQIVSAAATPEGLKEAKERAEHAERDKRPEAADLKAVVTAAGDTAAVEKAKAENKDANAKATAIQVQLLVWIFVMRIMMIIASAGSYFINEAWAYSAYSDKKDFNYEHPLTALVWLTSIVSVILTYIVSFLLIPDLNGDGTLWWKLSTIITCGTLAGAIIPELVKVFTSTESGHVKEVVRSAEQGGASLNILSGLVAGNFSAYWLGVAILSLMGIAYWISTMIPAPGVPGALMLAPAVFAFGLVAFGFLGMGPVTIAVDSYGPVTDNAQSVYELSTIETLPNIKEEIQKEFGFTPDFHVAKENLEKNDGAGNTFKATAKPVLIGTAVVGATTMIFAIIMSLTEGLKPDLVNNLAILNPLFLLGLIAGGAIIYWFTGASTQAVTTGAYRAVEFIKKNIRLDDTVTKASTEDSKSVVEICTRYAQTGMFNIFLTVFFATLGFAFLDPFFFIGYLVSIALFGLYQAIFMANAGGAWDNAKKIVEVELKAKGTPLHDATVVGDTVGDPFKDTSSVALNPIIKFTTLFGLLAVELAVELTKTQGHSLTGILSATCLIVSMFFVWRSFYGMRIQTEKAA